MNGRNDGPGGNGQEGTNSLPNRLVSRRVLFTAGLVAAGAALGFAVGKERQLASNETVVLLSEVTGTIDTVYVAIDETTGHDILVVEGKIFQNPGWDILHVNLTTPDPDNKKFPGKPYDPNDTEETGNKIIGRAYPKAPGYYSMGVDLTKAQVKPGTVIRLFVDAYLVRSGGPEKDNSRITSHTLDFASETTVVYNKA